MSENNTAVTKTPMVEYVVDGDKLYPKQAPPTREHTSAAAKAPDRPKDPAKSKSRLDG